MPLGERNLMQITFRGKEINNLKKLPKQGFSNENYSFTLDKKIYLFRKFKLKDRNREQEFEIQSLAYKKDLAAKPMVLDLENGYIICQFLEGQHKEKLEREDIQLMVHVIKKLHALETEYQVLDLKNEFTVLDKSLKNAFKTIDSTLLKKWYFAIMI